MEERLTIGAFARRTGLTPKALRHYDAIGLLVPAAVDPTNGYRLYDRSQLARARDIRRMRDLEIPLEDIRAILDDPSQASKRLEALRREAEAELFRRQRILHRLRWFDEPHEGSEIQADTHAGNQEEGTTMSDETEGTTTQVMGVAVGALTPQEERQLAADLFNHTWELLELPVRTAAQDDRMVHAAHASRFHWERVGTPTNFAVGEWQCSRVYSVLGRAEPALHHGRRCLEICEEGGVDPFYVAEAYEAIARALAVAGDRAGSAEAEANAWRVADSIEDPEERQVFEQDIATVPR
jgi:DNA-binding transcriptional MerR regulator